MLKQIYEIDTNGYIKKIYAVEFDGQRNPVAPLADNIVTVDPPNGLYRAKWTGTEWVEDKSKEEFEAEELLNDLIPTTEQIKNAEIEIKILTLLQEVMI